jgi:hypothetical protein
MKSTVKTFRNHILSSRYHKFQVKQPLLTLLVSVSLLGININKLIADAARAMSRTSIWTDAWRHLYTLRSGKWIDATVATFYLSHVWYDRQGQNSMRYLDMYSAMATELCDAEVDSIRSRHFIPQNAACTVVPVGFVVHHCNHFFTVIFDYQRGTAHVLGRHISKDAMDVDGTNPDDWKTWGGPGYWRTVAALHGWTAGDPTNVSIRAQDWEQNGVDCGPIACSVLEQILTAGLDEDGNVPPIHIQCGHILRMKIFRVVFAQIPIRCRDYMMLLENDEAECISHEMPDEDVVYAIQRGKHPAKCRGLLDELVALSVICEACKHSILIQATGDRFHTNEDYHEISVDYGNQFENEDGVEKHCVPRGKSSDVSLEKDRCTSNILCIPDITFFHRVIMRDTDRSRLARTSAGPWTETWNALCDPRYNQSCIKRYCYTKVCSTCKGPWKFHACNSEEW